MHQIHQRYLEIELIEKTPNTSKSWVYVYKNKKNFDESIALHEKETRKSDKNLYDLLVPKIILSPKCRGELRIPICVNPRNRNDIHRNTVFSNGNKVKKKKKNCDCDRVLIKEKSFDRV